MARPLHLIGCLERFGLEIMFGPAYEIIPVLVLTAAREQFEFAQIGDSDMVLPVCASDMLFNVFDEYIGFLKG